MLWQNSGLLCSFHQRRTKFFISHKSNHWKCSSLESLFFVWKSPCCLAASYRAPQTFSIPQTSALLTDCFVYHCGCREGRHTKRSFHHLCTMDKGFQFFPSEIIWYCPFNMVLGLNGTAWKKILRLIFRMGIWFGGMAIRKALKRRFGWMIWNAFSGGTTKS